MLDEFLAADVVVIGAPMYNFTVPSQLKAWIDRIAIAGKTFHYTANGPEGLVKDKRVIIALARGDFYGEGAPAAPLEHLETYLRGLFNFIGVEPEFVSADGLGDQPRASRSLAETGRKTRSSCSPPDPFPSVPANASSAGTNRAPRLFAPLGEPGRSTQKLENSHG